MTRHLVCWLAVACVVTGCGARIYDYEWRLAEQLCATHGGVSYVWGDGGVLDGACQDMFLFPRNLRARE